MTTTTTKIERGEYKVECNGNIYVIRQRVTTDTLVKKGWLIFSTGETLETKDTNNWGANPVTKKQAIDWIREESS